MIYRITNNDSFKQQLCQAWEENTQLWQHNRTLPKNVTSYILETIRKYNQEFSEGSMKLLDIGCGNAWVLDQLRADDSLMSIEYFGLDINPIIIENLKDKHSQDSLTRFIHADFEKDNSLTKNIGQVDFILAVLSFIEMPDLEAVFSKVSALLKRNGILQIIVLNPYLELIRLNHSYSTLLEDLKIFREGGVFYYKKTISPGTEQKQGSQYYGLLHKMDSYIFYAAKHGIQITDIKELDAIEEYGERSTIYNALTFNN